MFLKRSNGVFMLKQIHKERPLSLRFAFAYFGVVMLVLLLIGLLMLVVMRVCLVVFE